MVESHSRMAYRYGLTRPFQEDVTDENTRQEVMIVRQRLFQCLRESRITAHIQK
jgi:DNA phosphorothioation-dependent restriction protein DptG